MTDFALPDFDGHTAVGVGVEPGTGNILAVGQTFGAATVDLNEDNIPTTGVPELSVWAMTMLGFAAIGFGMRRGRRVESCYGETKAKAAG